MLTSPFRTFNPGALQSDEVVHAQFVARTQTRDEVLATLLANIDATPCQHILLEGPAGAGKTMLLAEVEGRLRTEKKLSPVRLPDDDPLVTPADVWRAVLLYLDPDRDVAAMEAMKTKSVLAEIQATKEKNTRLVVMVENIQNDEKFMDDLLHDPNTPSFMLLATTTRPLDSAVSAFFQTHNLQPLSDAECRLLWDAVTGDNSVDRTAAAVRVLTDGNPRLVVTLGRIARQSPSPDLFDHFVELLDAHTGHLRANMASLSNQQRRVYSAVGDLWEASTPSEIARCARLPPRTVSTLLGRLVASGLVDDLGDGRTRRYAARDPLFGFYRRLKKRTGGADDVHQGTEVRQLLRFMEANYGAPIGRWTELPAKILAYLRDGHIATQPGAPVGNRVATTEAGRATVIIEKPDNLAEILTSLPNKDTLEELEIQGSFGTLIEANAIAGLTQLKRLRLYGPMPKELAPLEGLEELWIIGAPDAALPKGIGGLQKLKSLRVRGLKCLPAAIAQLTELEELWIEEWSDVVAPNKPNNDFTLKELCKHEPTQTRPALERLHVGNVTQLPDLSALTRLRDLTLVGAEITVISQLPETLAGLAIAGPGKDPLSMTSPHRAIVDPPGVSRLLAVSKRWGTRLSARIPVDAGASLTNLRALWLIGGFGGFPADKLSARPNLKALGLFGAAGTAQPLTVPEELTVSKKLTLLNKLEQCLVTGSVPAGTEVDSWRTAVTRRGVVRGLDNLKRLYGRAFVVRGDSDVDTIRAIVEHVIELSGWGDVAATIVDILKTDPKKAAALLPLVVAMQLRVDHRSAGAPEPVWRVADDILTRVKIRSAQIKATLDAKSRDAAFPGPWLPNVVAEGRQGSETNG